MRQTALRPFAPPSQAIFLLLMAAKALAMLPTPMMLMLLMTCPVVTYDRIG